MAPAIGPGLAAVVLYSEHGRLGSRTPELHKNIDNVLSRCVIAPLAIWVQR